jgi:hypothetical protein
MSQTPTTEDLYEGDGVQTVFALTFSYIDADEVFVTVNGVNTPYTWVAGSTASVQLSAAPADGTVVRVFRNTKAFTVRHEFAGGVPFLPRYVDENNRQLLYVAQETVEVANEALEQTLINIGISDEALSLAQSAALAAAAAQALATDANAASTTALDVANAASDLVGAQAALVTLAVDTAQAADQKATEALELVNEAGVASFNTRTGAVVPEAGDYTDAQITSGGGTVATKFAALAASGHVGTLGALNESQLNDTNIASGRYAVVAAGLGLLPINVNSYLDVYDNASAGFARQRVTPVTSNREFTRNCVSGVWQGYIEHITTDASFVAHKTALRAVLKGSVQAVTVLGDAAAGDGGGATYYYDAADTTSADNGGSIIVGTDGGRWKITDLANATVLVFGGKADNNFDNSPVVQRMLTAGLREIVYGPGVYMHRSPITIPQTTNLAVRGSSFRRTQITSTAAVGFATYSYQRASGAGGTVTTFDKLAFVWSGTARAAGSAAIKYYGFSDALSDNWFRTEDCTFQNFEAARNAKWAGQCYSTRDFFANNRYDNYMLRGCSFWYFTECMSFSPTFIFAQDTIHDAFSNGLFMDQCHNITAANECLFIEGWQAVFIDQCGFDLGSGGAAALYFNWCQDVYVDECFISSNGVADRVGVVFVNSHTGGVTKSTLVNSKIGITTSPPAGMGTHIVIDGNKFEGNRDNDVLMYTGSKANKVVNNHFQTVPSRTGSNFEVYANTPGTDGNIIAHNTFRGTAYTLFTGSNSITSPNLFGVF